MTDPPTTLRGCIALLKQSADAPLPIAEDWTEHIRRISTAGRIAAVSEEQYDYWLEVLPPRWMSGSHFCFAEGVEPFRLFWKNPDGTRFARQLTWDETAVFCRLARISLPD